MTEIESSLRAAMHAAVDGAEAFPNVLIREVRRRHRRHTAIIAGAVVLAVLAAAVPAAIVARALTPSSPPLTQHVKPKPLPSRMSGLPMPVAPNFQLLVATAHGAGWYSTVTRRITPIAGLPSSGGVYLFSRVQGGWIAWSSRESGYACSSSKCSGESGVFFLIGDGSSTATRNGSGVNLAPAGSPGSLWLFWYRHPTHDTETESGSVRQLSSAGRPLGPTYQLPAGFVLWRQVGSDLLLGPVASGPDLLWNPRSRQIVRRFTDAIDAGPDQIVWSQGCASCRLQVLNILTGRSVQTAIPANPPGGLKETVTDDGSLLAARLPSGELAVLNTGTGALFAIPGTAVSSSDWQNFSWRDGDHELVVTAGPNGAPGPVQIAYWDPGDTRLRVATVRDAQEITELETGNIGS